MSVASCIVRILCAPATRAFIPYIRDVLISPTLAAYTTLKGVLEAQLAVLDVALLPIRATQLAVAQANALVQSATSVLPLSDINAQDCADLSVLQDALAALTDLNVLSVAINTALDEIATYLSARRALQEALAQVDTTIAALSSLLDSIENLDCGNLANNVGTAPGP